MIAPETMDVAKPVFYDPQGHVAMSRKFWRTIGKGEDIDIDGLRTRTWIVENVLTGHREVRTEKDLKRFDPVSDEVFCDVDLNPLIGKTVSAKLRWGSTLTGCVQGIETVKFDVNGIVIELPVVVKLEGEPVDITGIESITTT